MLYHDGILKSYFNFYHVSLSHHESNYFKLFLLCALNDMAENSVIFVSITKYHNLI